MVDAGRFADRPHISFFGTVSFQMGHETRFFHLRTNNDRKRLKRASIGLYAAAKSDSTNYGDGNVKEDKTNVESRYGVFGNRRARKGS